MVASIAIRKGFPRYPELKIAIFKFLYAQIDPYFAWNKKFEDEIPQLLKGIRYLGLTEISIC
jgi:SMC interacting uncharacterized protein involved in chromosome segregation